MKILFILENYHPKIGGLEKLFKLLVETLTDQGHEISILTNGSGVQMPWLEKSQNLRIYRLPFFNRYLFTFLAVIPGIWLAARNDLIHTTSYNAGIPAWLAGKLTKTKVVITFHEVWAELWDTLPFFSPLSKKLHYRFEQFLLSLPFHFFVAPSDFTRDRLIQNGIPISKVNRIYNGLDYEKYLRQDPLPKSPSKTPFSFLYFGRLGISKGLELLVAAAEIMQENNNDFVLTLILPTQPKPLLKTILALIDKHHVQDKVQLQHHLSEEALAETVQASGCVVIPSHSEGFCFVAVETIAWGTPILSSGRGALTEVISGKHITYPEQSAVGLAKGMSEALAGKWHETPMKKFPLAESVAEYVKLYNKIKSDP